MQDAVSRTPAPKSELEAAIGEIVDRLRARADAADASISCQEMVTLMGNTSHILVITIFSALNLLPGPPGYSVVIGLCIMAFAVLMLRNQPLHLWDVVGRFKLPAALLLRMMEFLAFFAKMAGRFSTRRSAVLTSERVVPLLGGFAIILGLAMLPPLPFTNMLPSLGLAIAGVGMLNRDGYALIAGVLIASLGLVVLVALGWLLFLVGLMVGDIIDDDSTQ